MKCIWCKSPSAPLAREHIFPDALGCPEELSFTNGEVCKNCNNTFGKIDQAVSDDFDLISFTNGILRKKGKPPIINNRGNVLGDYLKNGEPIIHINMGRHPLEILPKKPKISFGKSKRNLKAKLSQINNTEGKVNFKSAIGEDPRFARSITKIAFSLLAYHLGAEKMQCPFFDPIRDYVIHNKGDRKLIYIPCQDGKVFHQTLGYINGSENEFGIRFRLLVVEFFGDLSPTMSMFPVLYSAISENHGQRGWGYLPVEPKVDFKVMGVTS